MSVSEDGDPGETVPEPRPSRVFLGHTRRALAPSLWVPPVVGFAVVGVVWQIAALHNPYTIPRFGAIWQSLDNDPRLFLTDALRTLSEAAIGLGASFVVAFSAAVVMCHLRFAERALMPLAVVLNVTPVVALAAGLTLLGFGEWPKYVITAIVVFFPLLVNSLAGLRSIDPEALEVFLTLDASRREILFRLRIPSSLPFLFAAARVAFPLAVVGAVVAEFVASSNGGGLGALVQSAESTSDLPELFAAIVCLALLGIALTIIVSLLEARFLSWHSPSRRGR